LSDGNGRGTRTISGVPDPETQARLAAVFEAYHDFVWRTLRLLGVATSDIDDATQEVFVVLSRRITDHDEQRSSLRSWVYGIARNIAAQHRQRRAVSETRDAGEASELVSSEQSPEEWAARSEALARVHAFLGQLPQEQREVFVMCEVEGLSAPELADSIDVPLNTIYSRLRLARARFKKFLRSEHAGTTRLDHHG
jgi:RNA polymerase sigma-70 factor (ECF subfamily)